MTDKIDEIDELLTAIRGFADEHFGPGAIVLLHFAKLDGFMIQPLHTASNMTPDQLSSLLFGLAVMHGGNGGPDTVGDPVGSC